MMLACMSPMVCSSCGLGCGSSSRSTRSHCQPMLGCAALRSSCDVACLLVVMVMWLDHGLVVAIVVRRCVPVMAWVEARRQGVRRKRSPPSLVGGSCRLLRGTKCALTGVSHGPIVFAVEDNEDLRSKTGVSSRSEQGSPPPSTSCLHQRAATCQALRQFQRSRRRRSISPYLRYLNNHASLALPIKDGACMNGYLKSPGLGLLTHGLQPVLHKYRAKVMRLAKPDVDKEKKWFTAVLRETGGLGRPIYY